MSATLLGTNALFNVVEPSVQPPPQPEACRVPKEVGPCRASFRRWFFNSQTGQCEQFIYGGCRGNNNNFDTKAECQERCLFIEPSSRGQCPRGLANLFYCPEMAICSTDADCDEEFICCDGPGACRGRKICAEPDLTVCEFSASYITCCLITNYC